VNGNLYWHVDSDFAQLGKRLQVLRSMKSEEKIERVGESVWDREAGGMHSRYFA
jgi:hypothetical protein